MPYWRLSSIYFIYFAVIGAMAPYWSLYLKSLGFSSLKIGVLASIPLFVRLIVPNIWGDIADRTGERVMLIRLGAIGSVVAFSMLLFVSGFYLIAFAIAAYSFFWNAIMAQAESITLRCLKDRFARYGRVRLWGSIGFIVAVVGLGWFFDHYAIDLLPLIIELMLITLLVAVGFLKRGVDHVHQSDKRYGDFLNELKSIRVAIFFASTFLLHASHGAYYVFFSIYAEAAGYSRVEIGLLWMVGVLAEIVLFVVMHKVLARFSLWNLLTLCALATSLRWVGTAFLVDYAVLLVFLQLLHALSFGVAHAAAVEFCRRRFSEGMLSRGQAFYSSVSFGAGSAFGALVSGYLWDYGASLTFVVAAGMAVFAFILIVLTRAQRELLA